MYFLGGDRIYIKPELACNSLQDQINDCLSKLQKINSGKKIFKLNFFVDTASNEDYEELKSQLLQEVDSRFHDEFIVAFIAQPPLTSRLIAEAFYYDPAEWEKANISDGKNAAALFKKGTTRFLIGKVEANSGLSCLEDSEMAFSALQSVLEKEKFYIHDIIRQWNYLENILGYDGEHQRYQEFNNVRSANYGDFFGKNGYPAATGIGMNRGGIIIEFIAVQSDDAVSKPIDNPGQVSAHRYSEEVLVGEECILKTTPKFERARYLAVGNKKVILISGTASITGEHTIGVNDPKKQTEITVENIRRLYSLPILQNLSIDELVPKYGHARVYVKNKKDFPIIKKAIKAHLGDLPVVYIIADICRDDLLVEIEGKVILE